MTSSPTQRLLPEDFLSRPAVHVTKQIIDFPAANIPEFADCYASIIDGAFSSEECKALISAAEASADGKWEPATVNVGSGIPQYSPRIRNHERIIWDDAGVMGKIWDRIKDHVPEILSIEEEEVHVDSPTTGLNVPKVLLYTASRLNERMRFLRYTGGQYFKEHEDASYETPDGKERSRYTVHIYLNDSDEMKGGATVFYSDDDRTEYKVHPKEGRVLLFQHDRLFHSGEDVQNGVKYTLRTDLMFKRGAD
ncbi:MAG: hypothetical protein Q9220_006765 [cf. Caloplaca sp. 1 TL-2023]